MNSLLIVFTVIGLLVGGLVVYFVMFRRLTDVRLAFADVSATLKMRTEDLQQKSLSLKELQQEADALTAEITRLTAQNESRQKEIELLQRQSEEEARQQREVSERHDKLRQEQFQEQLRVVREQFQNLAARMLTQTSNELQEHNNQHMQTLTKPISDSFAMLQRAIADSNERRATMQSSLSEQLRQVAEQAEKMDRTASKLTNALKGSSKQAGDWGELFLNELLDSQGFRRGIDYDVQETIVDKDGRIVRNEESGLRMRPDVILHYPGHQDVIIDAKVSIKDYYEYVNESSEQLRSQMLDRHVQSLRSHVRELAQKDYSRYIQPPRVAIDFVIMFVPNEGALQVALSREPRLWNDAFEQKVFICSTQNLFAILRMIQIAWRQHYQTENQKRIVLLAEQLLSRVGLFTERAQKLGRDIDTLKSDFEDMQKSVTGRLSIVQKANELKKLGVKDDVKHPLPVDDDDAV